MHWWRQEGDGWAFASASNDLLIDGDKACALTRYQLQPPAGPAFVSEVFEVHDGQITALAIYFDCSPFPK